MTDFNLSLAFSFSVAIDGDDGPAAIFQEVSGIESEIETTPIAEGGESRFLHRLPRPVKTPNLRLKRGLAHANSLLLRWVRNTIEGSFANPVKPKNLTVSLYDQDQKLLRRWTFANAWPVKWSVGDFDSSKTEVMVESIELTYTLVKRTI